MKGAKNVTHKIMDRQIDARYHNTAVFGSSAAGCARTMGGVAGSSPSTRTAGADLGTGVFKARVNSDPKSDWLQGTAHLQIGNDQYQFNFRRLEEVILDENDQPIGGFFSGFVIGSSINEPVEFRVSVVSMDLDPGESFTIDFEIGINVTFDAQGTPILERWQSPRDSLAPTLIVPQEVDVDGDGHHQIF
jgi:hypothetical protein